jgi:hypothetical protein
MADTTTGNASAAANRTAGISTRCAVADTATTDASATMARTATAMAAAHTSTAVASATTRATGCSAAGAAATTAATAMCVRIMERAHGQREQKGKEHDSNLAARLRCTRPAHGAAAPVCSNEWLVHDDCVRLFT